MNSKYPTLESLVKQNKNIFYSEFDRSDLFNATKVLNEEKEMFIKKIRDLEKSTEQLNDYDNSTKSKNATQTEEVRLFFKGKVSWYGIFKPRKVEYDIEINDTMLWGIIGYMLDEKKHFENCVEAIEIAMKEITEELKEVSQ
ncbi:hypothetical protein [Vagococcus fluvialis]|uniref:hypothetical protein n=1 Tax=Vagococcus fluvialis TaxID=2738 RepID=UPI003D0DFB34